MRIQLDIHKNHFYPEYISDVIGTVYINENTIRTLIAVDVAVYHKKLLDDIMEFAIKKNIPANFAHDPFIVYFQVEYTLDAKLIEIYDNSKKIVLELAEIIKKSAVNVLLKKE